MDPKERKQKALEKLDELYKEPASEETISESISDSLSSNLTRTSASVSDTIGGSMMSNLLTMIMMFIFLVILIAVGASVLTKVETTQTTVGISMVNQTSVEAVPAIQTITEQMTLLSYLPVASIILMGGLALFYLMGWSRGV